MPVQYAWPRLNTKTFSEIPEGIGIDAFLSRAQGLVHPCHAKPTLHPTLTFAVDAGKVMGDDLVPWRRQVLDELWDLRLSFASEQEAWYANLPLSIQRAYGSSSTCRQVPLMKFLATKIGFPFNELAEGYTFGFPMVGLIPSENLWTPLSEPRKATRTVEELLEHSKHHLSDLIKRKPCKQWETSF